jgi:hypothetical protein
LNQVKIATELRSRIDALSTGSAYRNYLTVRDRVLEMLDRSPASGIDRPSGYWREELAGFEYMLDASPLIIDKLRHHTYHLTGLKVYDYRTGKDEYERQLREKLDTLLEVGREELFVPEPAELGGFGFRYGDGLFNLDTLKFFEAMIALDRGALLTPLRTGAERHVAWEIGAGWGGLAYTFKTLCPNTSYLIVDLPQVFLFSAVYLMTVMPDARFAFHGDGPLTSLVPDRDFVFVPHWALDELELPRLDLTLNMVSFQEMTTAQVEAYVDVAWRLGSQYLYSLNRDRSHYNTELSSVRQIIERRFRIHEIPVLDMPYTQLPRKGRRPKPAGVAERMRSVGKKLMQNTARNPAIRTDYRHIVGRRRHAG